MNKSHLVAPIVVLLVCTIVLQAFFLRSTQCALAPLTPPKACRLTVMPLMNSLHPELVDERADKEEFLKESPAHPG